MFPLAQPHIFDCLGFYPTDPSDKVNTFPSKKRQILQNHRLMPIVTHARVVPGRPFTVATIRSGGRRLPHPHRPTSSRRSKGCSGTGYLTDPAPLRAPGSAWRRRRDQGHCWYGGGAFWTSPSIISGVSEHYDRMPPRCDSSSGGAVVSSPISPDSSVSTVVSSSEGVVVSSGAVWSVGSVGIDGGSTGGCPA